MLFGSNSAIQNTPADPNAGNFGAWRDVAFRPLNTYAKWQTPHSDSYDACFLAVYYFIQLFKSICRGWLGAVDSNGINRHSYRASADPKFAMLLGRP